MPQYRDEDGESSSASERLTHPDSITLQCEMTVLKVPLYTTLEAVVDGRHKGTIRMTDHTHFREENHHLACGVEKVVFEHTGQGSYTYNGETNNFDGTTTDDFNLCSNSETPIFIKSFAPIYQGLCGFDFEFLNRETIRNYSAGGRTNAVHLRSIGGSYRPGDLLAAIEPFYVSSFFIGGGPYPYFWSLTKMMRETGIRPPSGMRIDEGKYYTVFDQGGPPEWHRTVAESIKMGDFSFNIADQLGNIISYKSFEYKQINSQNVSLSFVPIDYHFEAYRTSLPRLPEPEPSEWLPEPSSSPEPSGDPEKVLEGDISPNDDEHELGFAAKSINFVGSTIESIEDSYLALTSDYPEIMAGLERGAGYAAYGLQIAGEAALVAGACNPYSAAFTGGTACAASLSFVAANHTGVTKWAVDQAVEGASGLMQEIPGVEPRYADKTAGAVVGASCLVGTGKLATSLKNPLPAKPLQKTKLYDIERSGTVHGNSKAYIGDTHVYTIRNTATGETFKAGESMQGLNRHGLSKRAEAQARRLEYETGVEYRSKVRKTFATKAEARAYETQLIERYRKMYGADTLPGNKGNR
tara:strand:+ start:13601 stop:15343 length:1743 start_codon:yes stop_codon:yes gene_type:complete